MAKYLELLQERLQNFKLLWENGKSRTVLCFSREKNRSLHPWENGTSLFFLLLIVATIGFCCIVAWIQPDIFGCQQDFLVVWRWNQLRTFQGIFENNFIDFREAVSLEKIFEIVQENTLKFSKLISFLGNKKSSLNQCQAWSCYYATGCFVEFLGNFFSSTSSLGPPLFRHSSA